MLPAGNSPAAREGVRGVNEELTALLGGTAAPFPLRDATSVVMVVGLQGSGKTTFAAKLAAMLRKRGRRPLLVGLDVIGDYLTEVNVTSPTGIQEINALDGVRLESQVIDFVEQRAAKLARNSPDS